MQFNDSRRDFLTGAAKAGAAVAIVGSVPAMAAGSDMGMVAAGTDANLLHALGQRIGMDVAQQIGSFGTALNVTYMDAAGASVEALREGIETGARLGVGCGAVCIEQSLPYGDVLGVAHFQDPVTGRTARVEIFPESLSQLDFIAGATRSASLQKQAVMVAPADSLYSISVPSALAFA